VLFKDSVGNDCGRRLIKFQAPIVVTRDRGKQSALPFVVNNSDLGDLLRLISSCAAQ
jgi:hypothetical protein